MPFRNLARDSRGSPLPAPALVYSGLALAIRRLAAGAKAKESARFVGQEIRRTCSRLIDTVIGVMSRMAAIRTGYRVVESNLALGI